MEPYVQQLLMEQRKISQKLNKIEKIVNETNSEKVEKKVRMKNDLHVRNPNQGGMYVSENFNQTPMMKRDKRAMSQLEFKPSRLVVDDLQLLNESTLLKLKPKTFSSYHTSFLLITDPFQLNKYEIAFPHIKMTQKECLLPFIFTDAYVNDPNYDAVTLEYQDHIWKDRTHAYKLTVDLTMVRIISSSVTTDDDGFYDVVTDDETISQNFSEFVQIAKERGTAVMGLVVNSNAINFYNDSKVLNILMVRCLLYLKSRDYLLEQQSLMEQQKLMVEYQRALGAMQASSVGLGGLLFKRGSMLSVDVQEFATFTDDFGDPVGSLCGAALFGSYESQFTLDNQQMFAIYPQYLRKLYNDKPIEFNCQLLERGAFNDVNLDGIGLLNLDVNIGAGTNVCKRKPEVLVGDNSRYYQLHRVPEEIKKYYESQPLVQVINTQETKDLQLVDFSYINGDWFCNRQNKMWASRIKIPAGMYTLPPGTVKIYIDVLLFYPRMLPYSSQLPSEYSVELKIEEKGGNDEYTIRSLESEIMKAKMNVLFITVDLGEGLTVPAIRCRIPIMENEEQLLGIRRHVYTGRGEYETMITGMGLLEYINSSFPVEHEWEFVTMDGERWDRYTKLSGAIEFLDEIKLPLLEVPAGFSTWTQKYDLEHRELVGILNSVIFRSTQIQLEMGNVRAALADLKSLVSHLVDAVNNLEKAFSELTEKLSESSHVPWWKKVLQGLVMVAGVAGTLVFPFCLPLAIGLIVGSSLIQVGMLFSEGDYLGGGIQLAGVLIGVGTGYYSFRKANASSFPVLNLKEAKFIEPVYPDHFDANLLKGDGAWVEVKPLKMLGSLVENVGETLIQKNKGMLRTLFKMENAPVHARLRCVTTEVVEESVFRNTVVSGVTDGMPYLSHINPRPGIFELKEIYQNGEYVNGWNVKNVPVGGDFELLDKSVQGLLLEGVGTNEEFKSLINSWPKMDASERSIALNDAQDHIAKTQNVYAELAGTRVPISFDMSLIKNVSNVFAKHAGIYELTGVTAPFGPNNCQTYATELRDFIAKGAIRKNKLNNSSFLNDLMNAFDTSTQFSHIYGPVLEKRNASIDSSLVPPLL